MFSIARTLFQLTGLRMHYFRSKWNLFDFGVLIIAVVDVVLDQTVFDGSDCSSSNAATAVDPSIIKIFRSLRIFRIIRSMRLVKVRTLRGSGFASQLYMCLSSFVPSSYVHDFKSHRWLLPGNEQSCTALTA